MQLKIILEMFLKKNPRNWHVKKGQELTEMDKRILFWQNKGKLVPTRELIKTPEQIEGIRRAGVINTAVLDLVAEKIHAGMSTCHGIPCEEDVLEEGDIINVDCTTILDGYFADASRMFIIGKTSPEKEKLVRVAKECLEVGMEACKPYCFVGDVGNAIAKHAHKNGFTVVRDLCGHGCGCEFHEDPDVEHYGRKGTGMLLVPGMTFTIEPMINMGTYEVFIDEADGWTVVTEDELPSAQFEHHFLMTENGLEILTH